MKKHRCPLCGHGRQSPHPDDDFIVCSRCSETLRPSELVRRATWFTRRRYCLRNFGTTTYPA